MDVLIFYEHKVREYPSCCALKAELERRGISVRICHNGGPGIWRYRIFSHPAVAVGPSALEVPLGDRWTCLNNYTDYLRGTANYFVNLQTEQIFQDDDMAAYSIVHDSEWRDRIIYICWGKKRRQQLLRHGIPEEQIAVAGAAHLDFLAPPLDSCYYSREELAQIYGLNGAKRWILFVSSYTYADIAPNDQDWILKVRRKTESADPAGKIEKAVEISTRSRMITLDWIRRYLSVCEDSLFIYRPHPGERTNQQMEDMAREFSGRFVIISSEPLQNWLLVSDIVDNWISTAIVDLWKLKKPCFLIHPLPPPEGFVPPTMDCNAAICTYEAFEAAHREGAGIQGRPLPVKEEELAQYYADSAVPAYQAVADVVEALLQRSPISTVKSRFRLKNLASLHHFRQVALAFFAFFRIRPSRFIPLFRDKLRRLEDIAASGGDVFFTDSEIEFCKRINRTIKKIGAEGTICRKY